MRRGALISGNTQEFYLYLIRIPNNNDKAMVGDTLNAPPRAASTTTASRTLPKSLLYSIFARIGGSGLDTDAFETLRASYRGGFLGKAVAYDNRQTEIPATRIHSLRWHPVRLLSSLDSPYYYGAKKKYLDWIAARHLATGRYDMFHSWSGDCLLSLREARKRGIPSILEIPTWHRDRGKVKRGIDGCRRREPQLPWRKRWKEDLLLQRDRFLEEYDLADLILVLSEKAAETFRVQGFSGRETVLSASRRGRGSLHARSAAAAFSRSLFRGADRAQRSPSSARGLASARA